MNSPVQTLLWLDLADAVIRERLQQAARDRLADQLRCVPGGRPGSPFGQLLAAVAPRHWLAGRLRAVAARLDPSVSPDTSLVVLKAR
jgi:hypothetical protein